MQTTIQHIFLLLLGSFVLFSCGGDDEENNENKSVYEDKSGKIVYHGDLPNILNVQLLHEPIALHPILHQSDYRDFILDYVFETLIEVNPETHKLEPVLVEELPDISSNKLLYAFELKKDTKWADGSPITVDDVIFSYKVAKCPLTGNYHQKILLEHLINIIPDSIANRRFTMVMSDNYVQNDYIPAEIYILKKSFYDPNNITDKYSLAQLHPNYFFPREDIKFFAENFNNLKKYGHTVKNIKGSGPYQISLWEKGKSIKLVKNKSYWGKKQKGAHYKQYLESIVFKIFESEDQVQEALKKQQLDVTTYLSPEMYSQLKGNTEFNSNYFFGLEDTYNFSFIAFNTKPDIKIRKPLFIDPKVRKAIAHAIPTEQIIDLFLNGQGKIIHSPIPSDKPEFAKDLKPILLNIDESKKLLTQSGWIDLDSNQVMDKRLTYIDTMKFEFELLFLNNSPELKKITNLIADELLKIGVVCKPKALSFKQLNHRLKQKDFDAYFGGWTSGIETDDLKHLWHTSSASEEGLNFGNFGDIYTDALINQSRIEIDPEKRKQLYYKFQKILLEQVPYHFMYSPKRRVVIHQRFNNKDLTILGHGVQLNNLQMIQ